jgi:hypothetical protein
MNMKKIIPFCIAGIFLCTVFSAAALSTEEKTHDDQNKGDPLVFVFGTPGNNNWYISQVNISFQYDPSDVAEIWYKIEGTWIEYTGKFVISDDGIHNIPWYWIDKNGSRWNGFPIVFKIDRTPPSVEIAKQKLSKTQVKFTATATDAASGMEKVEFYCDNEIKATLTASPYEWTWTGTENQEVKAIAYDMAGNLKESNILSTPCSYIPNLYMFIRLLIQKFFQLV